MDFYKSAFKLADLKLGVRGSRNLGRHYSYISLTFNGNLAFPLMRNPSNALSINSAFCIAYPSTHSFFHIAL